MQKIGFTKEHWERLRERDLFKHYGSYEEYISKRESEDQKKKEEGFSEEGFSSSTESIVGSVEPVWVKKSISQNDWKTKYSNYSSYCNLGEAGDFGHRYIGFLMVIPPEVERAGTTEAFLKEKGLSRLTDHEMVAVDNYRRANGISPTPLTVVPKKEKPQPQEVKPKPIQKTIQDVQPKATEPTKKENYQTQMMSSEAFPSVHDQEDTPEEIADQERVRQRFQEMREANEPIRLEDIPF